MKAINLGLACIEYVRIACSFASHLCTVSGVLFLTFSFSHCHPLQFTAMAHHAYWSNGALLFHSNAFAGFHFIRSFYLIFAMEFDFSFFTFSLLSFVYIVSTRKFLFSKSRLNWWGRKAARRDLMRIMTKCLHSCKL